MKKRVHHESRLQTECVKWFRYAYPSFRKRLFAIPNGGARSAVEAMAMQGEGVTPGIPDLFLALPRMNYAGMFIEMKVKPNKPSTEQTEVLKMLGTDYKAIICYSFDEFYAEVTAYLK